MKRLLLALMCLVSVAACNGPGRSGESSSTTVMRPTVIINTTKGTIRAVLFPIYKELDGKYYIDGAEKPYLAFTNGVYSGYYNNAQTYASKEILAEYAWFLSAAPTKDYAINFIPQRDIQPVRGTLCMMQLDSAGREPGIYADKRRFMLVRNVVREYHGQEMFPLKGNTFPIGQVIEGLDVLDKLDASDKIVGIEKGEDTSVSTEKLAKLGRGEISDFAQVLEK